MRRLDSMVAQQLLIDLQKLSPLLCLATKTALQLRSFRWRADTHGEGGGTLSHKCVSKNSHWTKEIK